MTSHTIKFCYSRLVIAVCISIALLTGCASNSGSSVRAQILSLNYSVQGLSPTNASSLAANLRSGNIAIADLMPSDPCNFTADFSVQTTVPDFTFNGAPGQNGANISIVAVNPTRIPAMQPPSCSDLEELVIYIGSNNTVLDVGTVTDKTSASIKLSGQSFSTGANGFFKATLSGFDLSDEYMIGSFEFMARQANGTVALISGTYRGNE